PAHAFDREREVQLASIQAQKDHLLKSATNAMRRAIFGDAGYGLDPLGTIESVEKLGADALKSTHQKLVTPDNGVLAIYGDVNPSEVHAAVEKIFANWNSRRSSAGLPGTSHLAPHASLRRVEETRDKKQAVLVVGFPGTTLRAPDRYALELLQEAC